MDPIEARLLIHMVVLGSAIGLVSLLRRKAYAFWVHLVVLLVLFCGSMAVEFWPELLEPAAVPLIVGFFVLALLPSLILLAARQLARRRRHAWAGPLTSLAGVLVGLPVPLRREASFYAAMAAAERGDEAGCARRLERLALQGALPSVTGGPALARVLPPASVRRWADVLAELDREPASGTAVRALEARAAAELGYFDRALTACRELDGAGPHGAGMRGQARRAVLACAGRADFLVEAQRTGLPVVTGAPGSADLAIARALEAEGRVVEAATRYQHVASASHGRARDDAGEALTRLERGEPRLAPPLLDHLGEIEALEHACRAEAVRAAKPHLGRPTATIVLCVVTLLGTLVQWMLGGSSELPEEFVEALAAGALSAPLILGEAEWWRLATTMLLHVGWVHLLMNLGSILIVGIPLERRIGAARTVLLYFASGWVASLASVGIAGTPLGVGASGAAMGVFGAYAVLLMCQPRAFGFVERARWQRVVWVTVAATAAVGWLENEFVDNAAHGFGFLAGALLVFPMVFRRPQVELRAGAVVRIAAVLLVAAQVYAVAQAALSAGAWLGVHDVTGAGVTARIASRSFVEEAGNGALVRRTPGATLIQFGIEGRHTPDAAWLLGEAAADPFAPEGLLEALRRGPASQAEATVPVEGDRGPARVERRTYRMPMPGWPTGRFHVVTVRRDGAFAVVFVPPEPEAETAHGPLVEELAASLSRAAVD